MVLNKQRAALFLSGGGEMGTITREKDWDATPVGPVESWPQSLYTTLAIVLNSKFPMFLFWGTELTCFYNDAYRPSLGKDGKHPSILGKPAKDAWSEIWHVIHPLIAHVLAGGEATWSEDQLIPIYRNGKLEDVYWTFSYSPVKNESGNVAGVLVTCTETTLKVNGLKEIKEQQAQLLLEESEKKFRTLADSMPQHIWTSDVNGNMNYHNKSVFDYSGLTSEQIKQNGWLQIVHPDDRDANVKEWANAINTGKYFLFEHRFKRYDGVYRWQLSRAIPQRDAQGNIQMWVGISTDIQDQKEFAYHLENLVIERTKELELKNKELEKMNGELQSFAYVSSHDLQEPLRKIQTFANRIVEKESESLSENAQFYFSRIQDAARRMQQLINDLLTYSRTSTADRKYERIHLLTLVKDVTQELHDDLEAKQGKIKTTELCEVRVIPFQFRQLLYNLFSNSLKFAKEDTPPVITVQSKIAQGSELDKSHLKPEQLYCHITIHDNGIGFQPKYAQKIFEVFQRLHGRSEYTGTGIGLAIVKKIVENHNGFISATGMHGEGATFDIYIPV